MLIFIIALNHPSFGIAKEIFKARISVYIKIFWKYQDSYFSVRIEKLKLKIGVSAQVEYILLAWKYEMLVFFTST